MNVFFDTSIINLICKAKYPEYKNNIENQERNLTFVKQLLLLRDNGKIRIFANESIRNELEKTKEEKLRDRLLGELEFISFSERRAGILPVRLPFTLFPESFEGRYNELVKKLGSGDARIIADLVVAIGAEGP